MALSPLGRLMDFGIYGILAATSSIHMSHPPVQKAPMGSSIMGKISTSEREAQKKLDMMKESNEIAASPAHQKMERKQTLEDEHRDALERAVALQVPRAALPSDPKADLIGSAPSNSESDSNSSGKTNWVDLVDKLFSRNDFGGLILKTDISVI